MTRATIAGASCDLVPVARERLEPDLRIEGTERRLGGAEAAHDAGLLEQELARADRVLGHGRLGRDVAGADVLRERREHRPLERVRRYCHVSSAGSWPDRRTTCRSNTSLSDGKSARKCDPRLSSRVSALSAMSLVSRCGASRRCESPAASRMRPQSRHSACRSSGVTGSVAGGSGTSGKSCRQRRLGERRERGPASEDETFEKRVRGQPVRAVHAGRRALARRVEARELAASVEVGEDAADGVVGGRSDGNRCLRGVVPLLQETAHERREAPAVDRAQIEQHRSARRDLARHDVAGSELVRETVALLVEQERSFSAQRLGEEERRVDEGRRVELDELEIRERGPSAVRRGHALADCARRIRRPLPQRRRTAGREQRGARREPCGGR